MDDLIERLKDLKTTVAALVGSAILLIDEMGYTLTIPSDKVTKYALAAAFIGLLLSGGKKKAE
jgi:hypothetical protein